MLPANSVQNSFGHAERDLPTKKVISYIPVMKVVSGDLEKSAYDASSKSLAISLYMEQQDANDLY